MSQKYLQTLSIPGTSALTSAVGWQDAPPPSGRSSNDPVPPLRVLGIVGVAFGSACFKYLEKTVRNVKHRLCRHP